MDDFLDWRARQQSFEGLAAYTNDSVILSGDSGFSERYDGERVSPNTMSLLHVRPIIGRDFVDADTAPGAPAVLLLGHGLWMSRYGGDPAVVGRTLQADGTPAIIIGVMPEKFAFPSEAELWRPLSITAPVKRGAGPHMGVFGLLKRGVSIDKASTELTAIATSSSRSSIRRIRTPPRASARSSSDRFRARAHDARDDARRGVRRDADRGVNVTNLQLARAMERRKKSRSAARSIIRW